LSSVPQTGNHAGDTRMKTTASPTERLLRSGRRDRIAAAGLLLALAAATPARAGRATLSLDGQWAVADSVSATEMPGEFAHTAPVPGLANLARPPFPDVDRFISRENLANRIRSKMVPAEWLTNYWQGKVDQARNYFWYRKTFHAPAPRAVALLRINKAQFGTAVWLNGQPVGEYPGCFTASYFHLENAVKWNAENTLVIRIGAHPAVLPDTYPTGSDFEKLLWTPGIYDSVSVSFCDNPVIESVQVAPRIATSEIVVQTRVKNHGAVPVQFNLSHSVKSCKDGVSLPALTATGVRLEPGQERTVTQSLPMPGARLWTPEEPFLYVLRTLTQGDEVLTRFGMREFRFDAATKRAYLNGKVYYLRGSNITLQVPRYFEWRRSEGTASLPATK
jgi:beta-galactosidase/beta-glucuronidase